MKQIISTEIHDFMNIKEEGEKVVVEKLNISKAKEINVS